MKLSIACSLETFEPYEISNEINFNLNRQQIDIALVQHEFIYMTILIWTIYKVKVFILFFQNPHTFKV